MSTDVVAVPPDATLQEIAEFVVEHGIAGVPVCRAGRVVGVVVRLVERAYGDARRTIAVTALQAMSFPPLTIEPDTAVAGAARRGDDRVWRLSLEVAAASSSGT